MASFAERTAVPWQKSQADIQACVLKYGATNFMTGVSEDKALVAFECAGRRVRFVLPLPAYASFDKYKEKGRAFFTYRTKIQQQKVYDQAIRQRWRALFLVIKAKLEAVSSGICEFEDEFLAHIVLPNGQTMGEHSRPLIAQAYEDGKMPPLLGHDG